MLKIFHNRIHLTKGDTAFIELDLRDQDDRTYIPAETDRIIFRVKRSPSAKEVYIEKEIDPNTLVLVLNAEDTINLPFSHLKYEVEVINDAGYHFTAIENTEFEVGVELEGHYA